MRLRGCNHDKGLKVIDTSGHFLLLTLKATVLLLINEGQ
jgi:hypothetical protein